MASSRVHLSPLIALAAPSCSGSDATTKLELVSVALRINSGPGFPNLDPRVEIPCD